MSVQVEVLENNKAKMTITVPAEKFMAATETVYKRNRSKFQIPGFRKGKTPKKMIEKMYGEGVFWQDAMDIVLNETYPEAAKESELAIVSSPEVDILEIGYDKDIVYTAEVFVKPEVTLGDYKGVEVDKYSTRVTQKEIEAVLEEEAKKNARQIPVEDGAVEDGDTVILDFEGFVDGEAFEGGKGENYSLVIGSGQFIPGFEEQLIGAELEKELDVNVTFPEQYHAEELAGKDATFKCTVHDIKRAELPEIDDDFASEVSEFDTLDEYKAKIKADLKEKKADDGKRAQEDKALETAVENATVDIPACMIEDEQNEMIQRFSNQLEQSGLSLEQYTQYFGQTEEQLKESYAETAAKNVKSRLVLEAIVKAEGIEASEEELDAELSKLAETYKMELDQIKALIDADMVKADIANKKALDFIVENAVEK